MASQKLDDDWGTHINQMNGDVHSPLAPDWLSIKGQNMWKWRGLIVWRREPEQIVCIQPGYVAKIIKDLQDSTNWQQDGYTVGEWGISFEIDLKTKESKSSEPGLLNPMLLSPEQTARLATYIRANLDVIQRLCDEDRHRYESAMDMIAQMILQDMREHPSGS
jgi:hypothetical protein